MKRWKNQLTLPIVPGLFPFDHLVKNNRKELAVTRMSDKTSE